MSKKKPDIDLEDALRRLHDIVELLESDETKVQDAVRLYEESIGLVEICVTELSTVRAQVNELKVKAETLLFSIANDDSSNE